MPMKYIQLRVFGLVGLRHNFKIIVFQGEVEPRGWHLRHRIVFAVEMSLGSHEGKSNKTREEATTLQQQLYCKIHFLGAAAGSFYIVFISTSGM